MLNEGKALSIESLLNKLICHINYWQIPLLPKAGRNTLIKSMTSAIPSSNMFIL